METNNNPAPDNASLLDKLKQATEKKTPGATQEVKKETAKASSYWGADDFETEQEHVTASPQQQTATVEETLTQPADQQAPVEKTLTQGTTEEKPVTRAVKEAQARITTSSINTLQKLIFEFIVNLKTKKKFKPEEITRLEFISDANPTELTDVKDKNLWLKWDKIMKKRDKKIKKIDMTEDERRDMTAMFMDYQEASGRILSPGWGLSIQIADVLAKRAITTFMED
jgi:hypothetical protein